MTRVDALYICYWSLMDPLCQTQSLAYLKRLAAQGRRFALMTFEQRHHRLPDNQAAQMKRTLAALGIHWYPLTYHKRYSLLATGFDCLCGVLLGIVICWRHRARVVHSRSSIPAAIALVIKAVCRVKFLYDADSRLSEEYADNGHWVRGSLPFRLMAWVEATARRRADAVVVLSDRLRQDFVQQFGVRAPIEVIPCCVDTDRFRYDEPARLSRRRELGIGDAKLFVYVGKVGPRYLVSELFEFFKTACQSLGTAHLLILSGDAPERFDELARGRGVEPTAYTVRRAAHADVPAWLSAADAGFALIRPAGCERGSSPIKVAEYLACGLPVIMTYGIGDYSEMIRRERVGVVVDSLDNEGFHQAVDEMFRLWKDGAQLQARCRTVAAELCDLETVGCDRYSQVYSTLANQLGRHRVNGATRTRLPVNRGDRP